MTQQIKTNQSKMERKIIDLLKNKFDGVAEAILTRVAKKLAETATTDDEAKAAVEAVTFQQVLESYGDSRATDATKTAVLNYEKKHNIRDGKPVGSQDTTTTETPKNEEQPAWAKTLIDSVRTLSQEVNTIKGERLTDSRKQQLADVLANIPEGLRRGYERIPLETMNDEEFSTMITEIKTEVGDIAKTQNIKGAVFGRPTTPTATSATTAATPTEASKEELDSVVARMNI